jgi:pimeloyl-ACP methyl ester carboxylesterase
MDNSINLFKSSKGQSQYLEDYDAVMQLWPVTCEFQFLDTAYGQIHIISCGPKDAFPLVLLHAGHASSTMWFPNIGELSKSHHVFAIDTIGEPGKSTPSRPYATRLDSAKWIESVLDELGILKTHVIGLSRGGWFALNLTLHAPQRLSRIVLLSPAASFIPLNSFFSIIAQTVMHIPVKLVAKAALNSWVARGFVVNHIFARQFITGLKNWNWAVNAKGYSGMMPCIFDNEELSQVRTSVLLLLGDQDRLNPPEVIERAKQRISHIEAEIIPHAGHFLSMEQPDFVNSRILNFLDKEF